MKKKIIVVLFAAVFCCSLAAGLTACKKISHEHTYKTEVVAPTCTEQGYTLHTCTGCGDSYKDTYVSALGHSYGEPSWDWSEDYTNATATFTCTNDSEHVNTLTATVTDEVTTPATCTTDGEKDCTATVTFNNQTYTDVKTVTVEKTGHSISDNSCVNCGQPASEGLDMVLISEGEYTVSGIGTCTDTEILIPTTYNDLPVVSVEASAFLNNTAITSVVLPDGITSIGEKAFNGCESLTSVTFGKNSQLSSIGPGAFNYCYSLESITIPESVTSIGSEAFNYCCGLRSVTFGENSQLTSIGDYAFLGCYSLESITIPASVTSIGEWAFVECYRLVEVWNLSKLNITAGSEDNGYVGYYAKRVETEPSESYVYTDENGYVIYYDGKVKALINYIGNETKLTIPDDITELNCFALSDCYNITSVTFGEDKNSDDGRILIRLPEDFVVKAQSRDETKEATLTAYNFNQLCNNTTAEDYKQAQAESAPGSETPSDWNYVSVPEKARIASFDDSTLFRMPDGKYQDYTYYVPNKCVKENTEKGTIRLSLHNDYTVRLSDNSGEEKKTAELSAKDFCEEVRGKDAVAYGTEYKRPSVEANTSFDEKEKALRAAVPDEMKARPNWVVVKTWWNAEKGKYNKRPVNCNSDKGEYAESDNPETWTTFDNALKYLKEKGGTTVAYALDGKDNISCIDLDHCYDENGQPTALAKEILSKCGKTYVEKSVSGNGLHIFGKTEGMDIRSFSKDGDLEFYQKEHFIAMTGDGTGYSRLESFDTPEMKELLSRKCEKREEWKGVCKGVNGLSTMTDRDVVEKASNAKNGDKFKRLYAGEDLQNNHSNSDMSLMNLLAYWCNGDKEQMLRIFATSGLFRPNKSPDYYEGTAIKALRSMPVKSTYTPTVPKNTGGNGKR